MDHLKLFVVHCFLLFLVVNNCVGPPAKHKEAAESSKKEEEKPVGIDELGLEYNRYLKEVVDALESDPEFRKKLETAEEADFRNGKVAAELEYVNHHVRTKLDELKRTELERLRGLIKQVEEVEKNEVNPNHGNPGHVDHSNPHTFESADLHKLITQVRQDLAEADRQRREEFKEYELQKKFEQEQKAKVMDESHRKKFLEELEEQKKKHQKHAPLHHPGSKAQLEEVWEKEDHMENQKFNPRTFFLLHDINGDGYWDEDEVKVLFLKELDKLYQAGTPEDDMREREEEMERMREHVFEESDRNGDRLISFEEFLEQTKKQEFNKDEGWDTVDTKPQFSQHEYEEFEKRRQQEIQHLVDQGLLQPYAPGMMPPPPLADQFQQYPGHGGVDSNHPQQYAHNVPYQPHQGQGQYAPGQGQYAPQYPPQYPNQVPPHHNQVPPHPNQVPQHPNQVLHPNQVPQHPNQVPQHPNQVPKHPNQAPQYPNQAPQHPNQGVQQTNQQSNQIPQQPNQAHQHTNQAPQSSNQGVQQHVNNQIPDHPNDVPQSARAPEQGVNHGLNQAQNAYGQLPQGVNSQPSPNQGHSNPNSRAQQPPGNQEPQVGQPPNNQGPYGGPAVPQKQPSYQGNVNLNKIATNDKPKV